ncbi:hypothetical protein IQ266_11665 [filamentous cyanobacterium LEGE 11480]|uniref:Uncharacterized protein n=1 Tax=Romeriopsis navalis LEGE 11480 TaxID=2777977 RepID=A0A928VQR5_9CYAN|nr:hypothetical protein [Romeriopsis navalis]MBE9030389.1 hypothetical protein [Romeriopsis navalis LEGE 11480]
MQRVFTALWLGITILGLSACSSTSPQGNRTSLIETSPIPPNSKAQTSKPQQGKSPTAKPQRTLQHRHFVAVCQGQGVPEAPPYDQTQAGTGQVRLTSMIAPTAKAAFRPDLNYWPSRESDNLSPVSVVACIQENMKAKLLEQCEYRKSGQTAFSIKRYRSELTVTLRSANTAQPIAKKVFVKEAKPCPPLKFMTQGERRPKPEDYVKSPRFEFGQKIKSWAQTYL